MNGEERKGTEEGQGRDGILGWTEETWTATSCTALATFARAQAARRSYRSQSTPSSPINQRSLLQTCPPPLTTAVRKEVRACVPSPSSKTLGSSVLDEHHLGWFAHNLGSAISCMSLRASSRTTSRRASYRNQIDRCKMRIRSWAHPASEYERVTLSSAAPCASPALLNSGSFASSLSTCCLSTSGSEQCGSPPGGPIATCFFEAKDCRARRKLLKQSQGARLQSRVWWGDGGGMGGRDIATRMVSKPKFSAALRRPGPLHHARL